MARFLQLDRVSFAYPGMAEPLLADSTHQSDLRRVGAQTLRRKLIFTVL